MAAYLNALLIGSASLAMNSDQQTTPHEHAWRLISFAREGNLEMTKKFLALGCPADAKEDDDDLGWTALMHAASFGHHEVCQMLIDAKAQINIKDDRGVDPLGEAAMHGHKEVCQLLIKANAEINAKYNNNWTPLMVAAGWNHKEICLLFVDEIVKPIKQKRDAAIALLGMKQFNKAACMKSNHKEVIKLIARQIYNPAAITELFTQIDAIEDAELQKEIRAYALQQLEKINPIIEEINPIKKIKPNPNRSCTIM